MPEAIENLSRDELVKLVAEAQSANKLAADTRGTVGEVVSGAPGNGAAADERGVAEARAANKAAQHGAATGRSSAAFERLVHHFTGSVYAIAYTYAKDRETAEDLTQEVFLRAYLNLSGLKRPAGFPSWLHRMTRNLAIDWQRREQTRSGLIAKLKQEEEAHMESRAEETDFRRNLEKTQEETLLAQALDELPGSQRELLLLHYAEGLSSRQIADRLGIHFSTVNRRLAKVTTALGQLFEAELTNSLAPLGARQGLPARSAAVIAVAAGLSLEARASFAAATKMGAAEVGALTAPAVLAKGGVAARPLLWLWGHLQTASMLGGALMLGAVAILVIAILGLTGVFSGAPSAPPRELVMKQGEPLEFFANFGEEVWILHEDDPVFPGRTLVKPRPDGMVEVAQHLVDGKREVVVNAREDFDAAAGQYYSLNAVYYDPLCEDNFITDHAYRNSFLMMYEAEGVRFVAEAESNAAFGRAMAAMEQEQPAIMLESDWVERSLRLARDFDFMPASPLKQPLVIPDIEANIEVMRADGR